MFCFCGAKKWTSAPKTWGILHFRHTKRNIFLHSHHSYTKPLETGSLEVVISASIKGILGKYSTVRRAFFFFNLWRVNRDLLAIQINSHFGTLIYWYLPLIRCFSPKQHPLVPAVSLSLWPLGGWSHYFINLWPKHSFDISCFLCHLSQTPTIILSFTLPRWASF